MADFFPVINFMKDFTKEVDEALNGNFSYEIPKTLLPKEWDTLFASNFAHFASKKLQPGVAAEQLEVTTETEKQEKLRKEVNEKFLFSHISCEFYLEEKIDNSTYLILIVLKNEKGEWIAQKYLEYYRIEFFAGEKIHCFGYRLIQAAPLTEEEKKLLELKVKQ